jgi:glycosyltransferase involved in cell wall biosynthesis
MGPIPVVLQQPGTPKGKIVHVIMEDGPGGGPKTVLNHISYYSRIFDVCLLHGGSGMLVRSCENLNIAHEQIPLERLWKAPLGFLAILVHLLRNKTDVLILHGQWGAFFGAIAGWVANVPSMIYISQWPSFYTDWDLWRVFRNYVIEVVPCHLSKIVVAISPGNRDEYLRRYPFLQKRLLHIPNAIDLVALPTDAETQQLRNELGWADDVCHVVCVGRLSTQKRVDWILHAWKLVESEASGLQLSIIGDGEEGPSLRALAASLQLRTCHFLGSKPEAWRYIAASDIVAMPSMYEGHANVPLEAMACGRPIVACAVDGVRESLTDGQEGLLVAAGDPRAMADGILSLACNPGLRRLMGIAGMERAKTYEKGRLLRRYVTLINELIRKSSTISP